MRKLFVVLFILSISPLLALVGTEVPIKADEIISNNGSIVTVTPALTPEQYNRTDTALYTVEYLKEGGSLDFSNISDDYSIGDFIDDFVNSLDMLIDGKRYSSKDELAYKNTYNLTQLGLDSFMNVYMNNLGNLPAPSTPAPSPDENYVDYLATINGSGFFWRNYSSTNDLGGGYTQTASRYPFYEYSFCAWSNSSNLNAYNTYILDIDNGALAYLCMPITFNINGSDDVYQMQGTVTPYKYPCYTTQNGYYWNGFYFFRSPSQNNNRDWDGRGGTIWDNLTYSCSGTLADCLSYIAQRFRNVNINVNGIPWTLPFEENNFIDLGRGTYVENTNSPVEYQYPVDVYVDVDDLIERIEDIIDNKEVLTFDDIEDLIVDENGQEAVAVVVVGQYIDEDAIDDWYVKNYGTLIPIFPNSVSFPISVEKTASIVTTPLEGIPDDLLGVLQVIFLGTLMVCLLQRLLE